jgi:hypothetical protein
VIIRTGIVAATIFIKQLCHVLVTYRSKMDGVIQAAVVGGVITTTQRDILFTWLDGAQVACNIIRTVSGY